MPTSTYTLDDLYRDYAEIKGAAPTGRSYATSLSPEEEPSFQKWVVDNKIPSQRANGQPDPNFTAPDNDYDMRGFWKAQQAGNPNAKRGSNLHFPDTWKTPYHKSFSNESMYATKDAPHWEGNTLTSPQGQPVYRELSFGSDIDPLIEEASAKYGVDPQLARAIIQQESHGNPKAVSKAGAQGLMQLMPATAQGLGVTDAFDPRQNIDAGVRYLKDQLTTFGGDLDKSIAAYNAGPKAVLAHNGVPPYAETMDYVNKVKAYYQGKLATDRGVGDKQQVAYGLDDLYRDLAEIRAAGYTPEQLATYRLNAVRNYVMTGDLAERTAVLEQKHKGSAPLPPPPMAPLQLGDYAAAQGVRPDMIATPGTPSDNALQAAKELQRRVQEMNPDKAGVLAGMSREVSATPPIPFISELADASVMAPVMQAALKQKNNQQLSPEEQVLLDSYASYMSAQENFHPGIMDRVGSMLPGMAVFWGELALTGGLSGIAKKGTEKLAVKAIASVLKESVAKNLAKVPGYFAGEAVRVVAARAPAAVVEGIQRMTPEQRLVSSPDGQSLMREVDSRGEDFGEAMLKAFGSEAINVVAQDAGQAPETILNWLKPRMLNWAAAHGLETAAGLVKRIGTPKVAELIAEKAGWHGIVGQYFAAQVVKPLQNVLIENRPWNEGFSKEQLATEALGFLVFGSAARAMGYGVGGLGKVVGDFAYREQTARLDAASQQAYKQPFTKLTREYKAEVLYNLAKEAPSPQEQQMLMQRAKQLGLGELEAGALDRGIARAQELGAQPVAAGLATEAETRELSQGAARQAEVARAQDSARNLVLGKADEAIARGAGKTVTGEVYPLPKPPVTGQISEAGMTGEAIPGVPVIMSPAEREQWRLEHANAHAMETLQQERQRRADEELNRQQEAETQRMDEARRLEETAMGLRARQAREGRAVIVTDRRAIPAEFQLGQSEKGFLEGELDRIATENFYVTPQDMVRSLEEKKPRGEALTSDEKYVLALAKRAEGASLEPASQMTIQPPPTAIERPGRVVAPEVEDLPPVAEGYVRLYRGEEVAGKGKGVPEWLNSQPEYARLKQATGRWWTEDPEIAMWYVREAGDNGQLKFLDVPVDIAAESRVLAHPEARQFSADPEHEYFLPFGYASRGSTVEQFQQEQQVANLRRKVEYELSLEDAARLFLRQAEVAPTPEQSETLSAAAQEMVQGAALAHDERVKLEESIHAGDQPAGKAVERIVGRAGELLIPDHTTAYPFHYAVVNLKDLTPSHKPGTWEKNENAFQPRNAYGEDKAAQFDITDKAKKPDVRLLHSDDPTQQNGPPTIRNDGLVAGGNKRSLIEMLAYQNGAGDAIYGDLKAKASTFGIQQEIPQPTADYWPGLVRILDAAPTSRAEMFRIGDELNYVSTAAYSGEERAISAASYLEPADIEAIAAMTAENDWSLRELMAKRNEYVVGLMTRSGMIEPSQRARFVDKGGELTDAGKDLFEMAAKGRWIPDAALLDEANRRIPGISSKLDRALGIGFRLRAREDYWDLSSYLADALKLHLKIDRVRAGLEESVKGWNASRDYLVDLFLHPEKFKGITGQLSYGGETARAAEHPVTEALAKLLEGKASDFKEALEKYIQAAEQGDTKAQDTMAFYEPPKPWEAFNSHIGKAVGVRVEEADWGRPVARPQAPVEAKASKKHQEGLAPIPPPEVAAHAEAGPEPERGGLAMVEARIRRAAEGLPEEQVRGFMLDEVLSGWNSLQEAEDAAKGMVKNGTPIYTAAGIEISGTEVNKAIKLARENLKLSPIPETQITPGNTDIDTAAIRAKYGVQEVVAPKVLQMRNELAGMQDAIKGHQDNIAELQEFLSHKEAATEIDAETYAQWTGGEYLEPGKPMPAEIVEAVNAGIVNEMEEIAATKKDIDKLTVAIQKEASKPVKPEKTKPVKAKKVEVEAIDWKGVQDLDDFRAQAIAAGAGPKEAAGAAALIELRAQALGVDPKDILAHIAGIAKGGTPKKGSLAQEAPQGPVWVSKAADMAEQRLPDKSTGEQALATLRNAGVKEEEIKWLGLDDFLKGKGKVSKQEITDFIKQNDIGLKEVVQGAPPIKEVADQLYPGLRQQLEQRGYHLTETRYGWNLWHGDKMVEMTSDAPEADRDLVAQLFAADFEAAGRGAQFQQQTLPGDKTNYRELLLTLPTTEDDPYAKGLRNDVRILKAERSELSQRMQHGISSDYAYGQIRAEIENLDDEIARLELKLERLPSPMFTSGHWDEPNVLAHVRFDERQDAQGKRVLFVEEVQSDWHQKGKRVGYGPITRAEDMPQRGWKIEPQKYGRTNASMWSAAQPDGSRVGPLYPSEPSWQMVYEDLSKNFPELLKSGVPEAPFRPDWHELAMKRVLRYAAEHGYERIAWTTGEQQAQRYDLSKHIESIVYEPPVEGGIRDQYILTAKAHGGRLVNLGAHTAAHLPEVVGKDIADKIIKGTGEPYVGNVQGEMEHGRRVSRSRVLSNLDLKIGGDWAKALYDRAIPNFLSKYGKKWGAKVGETEINRPTYREVEPDIYGDYTEPVQSSRGNDEAETVHSLDVTPAMRDSVMQGQYLFQEAGAFFVPPESVKAAAELSARKAELEAQLTQAVGATVDAQLPSFFRNEKELREFMASKGFSVDAMQLATELDGINKQLRDLQVSRQQYLTQEKKGAVEFLDDGRALIHLFEKADFSTLVHELFHVFRRYGMTPEESALAEKAFGVEKGNWERKHDEKAARGFERWLYEGNPPTAGLAQLFQKFKSWMRGIYQKLVGSPINVQLSNDARELYRMMFTPQEIAEGSAPKLPAVPAEPEILATGGQAFEHGTRTTFASQDAAEQWAMNNRDRLAGVRIAREPDGTIAAEYLPKQTGEILYQKGKKEPALPPLPGFENVEKEREEARAEAEGERLSNEILEKKGNISKAAGEMERSAPLFRETEASGQKGLFTPPPPEGKDTLFQMSPPPTRQTLERNVALLERELLRPRNDQHRQLLRMELEDTKAQLDQLDELEAEQRKARTGSLWTPEGEVSVGGQRPPLGPQQTKILWTPEETNVEPQANKGGIAANAPAGAGQPVRPQPVVPKTRRPELGTVKPPTGGGVRPGAGAGSPAGAESATRSLADVTPAPLDPPVSPRGPAVYDTKDWKQRLEKYNLPENLPAPTARLSPENRSQLIFPGQKEIADVALSGLLQHHAFVLAQPTGSGKTFLGAALLSELKPQYGLILTANQTLIHADKGWIDVAAQFGTHVRALPPGEQIPSEPGVYITTYNTAIGRVEDYENQLGGLAGFKWDLVIADEAHYARGWHREGNKFGQMLKNLGESADKVLYMGATPFHTALEVGYMGKLGLWRNMGFEQWGRHFGIYQDERGWQAPWTPKKLMKLREQLIERGVFSNQERNMEGYTANFGQVELSDDERGKIRDIQKAFQMAKDYFQKRGQLNLAMGAAGNAKTFVKNYIERIRLPQALELGKKLVDEGWHVIFMTENKRENAELGEWLRKPDEFYGGQISRLIPHLPGVVETLQAALGDKLANFSGRHTAARDAELKAFNAGDKPYVYATYGAGGVGVNLHDTAGDAPRAAVYIGLPWSGVMLDQAIGRPWRYGTKSNVHAIFLTSDARPEVELVVKKIAPRLESLRAVISGISKDDPMVKRLKAVGQVDGQTADYDLGNEHDAQLGEFAERMSLPGMHPYTEVPIISADTAKNRGMKYPGGEEIAATGSKRLFQNEPEEKKAKEIADAATRASNPEVLPPPPGLESQPAQTMRLLLNDSKNQANILALAGADRKKFVRVTNAVAVAEAADRVGSGEDPRASVIASWKRALEALDEKDSPLDIVVKGVKTGAQQTAEGTAWAWRFLGMTGRTAISKLGGRTGDEVVRNIRQYHVMQGDIAGPWLTGYGDLLSRLKFDQNELSVAQLMVENATDAQIVAHLAMERGISQKSAFELLRSVRGQDAGSLQQRLSIGRLQQYVDAERARRREVALLAREHGVHVEWRDDDSGRLMSVPFPAPDDYYAPHNYDPAIYDRNSERHRQAIQSLMQTYGIGESEAEHRLAKMHNTDTPLSGNIERAREGNVPGYRTDPAVMPQYYTRAAEAIARTIIFGQHRGKLYKLTSQMEPDNGLIVNEIVDTLLAPRRLSKGAQALVNAASGWTILTKMTFSAIGNSSQGVNASLYSNTRSSLKGLLDTITDYKNSVRAIKLNGAILEQMHADMMRDFGTSRPALQHYLEKIGFFDADTFGRAHANNTAKAYMNDYALPKLMTDPTDAFIRRQMRDVYLLSDETIDQAIARGAWSEHDLGWAGKALSDRTQNTMDPTELPYLLRAPGEAGAFMRIATVLRGYAIRQGAILSDALIREARKGNFRPWIPFMILFPAVGEVIGDLSRGLRGDVTRFLQLFDSNTYEPAEALKRMAANIGYVGGLGFGGDIIDGILHGRDLGDIFEGPFWEDIAKLVKEGHNMIAPYLEEDKPRQRLSDEEKSARAFRRLLKQVFVFLKGPLNVAYPEDAQKKGSGTEHLKLEPLPQ